jgi:hypothetical protein
MALKRFRETEDDFYGELLKVTGNSALRAHVEKVKCALSVPGHMLPAPPDKWGGAEYRGLAGAIASADPHGWLQRAALTTILRVC